MLGSCNNLDEYLTKYGTILGRTNMEGLKPLHTPGVDDPVSNSMFGTPLFDPQAHVTAAAVKMLDRRKSGFIVGEMGCIAGETEIYDPVLCKHLRVDQIDHPFHVVSYHEGKAVVGVAHKPFVKGVRKLYTVTLSNGNEFVSTDHHRILTDRGYELIRDVAKRLESGPVPLPSIEESSLSGSQTDARRWSRTPSGSQAGCQTDRRSCGEQPLPDSGTDQVSPQQQGDARERIHCCSPSGDQASGQADTHACRCTGHPSTQHSDRQTDCTSHVVALEPRASLASCGRGESLDQVGLRSPEGSYLPDTTRSSDQSASRSCCETPSKILGEFAGESVHVTEIRYTRTDSYYDFTVDRYHNYVASTVVHHNTGKTRLGAATAHAHAMQHSNGSSYRALVMCPDHLIAKWEREIKDLIPEAEVHTFENWKSCIAFMDGKISVKRTIKGQQRGNAREYPVNIGLDESGEPLAELVRESPAGTVCQDRLHWPKPERPQWFVVGRNQSKWNPDWNPIGDNERTGNLIERRIIVGEKPKVDDSGAIVRKPDGSAVWCKKTQLAACCPRCGSPLKNKEGMPIPIHDIQDKQMNCKAWYLEQVSPEHKDASGGAKFEWKPGMYKSQGLAIIRPDTKDKDGIRIIDRYIENAKPGKIVSYAGGKYRMLVCNEPLWQWTKKPYRWPPAKLIQKKMRNFFDYMVVDEVHEEKSESSAQSMAMGKMLAASKRVIALTGTLIGGYAHHLFPLLVRMSPDGIIKEDGFEWGQFVAFAQKYGRVDTIITQKTGGSDDDGVIVGRRQSGMGRSRAGAGKQNKRARIAPGVMPHLFGRHLIGSSVFLSLDDMDETLPRLIDYEIEDEEDVEFPGAGPHTCEMDEVLETEYMRVEKLLEAANKELLKKGSMRLLGATLHTLLDYPDRPYDWPARYPAGTYRGMDYVEPSFAVGYHSTPTEKWRGTWCDVVQPADLSRTDLRDKEAKLIKICKDAKKRGYQTWVYCQMTGKRDVQVRLQKILEEKGFKVLILRSNTVPLRDREDWIFKNAKGVDVIISHPKLVETGLDLFDKSGNHNFNNIVFYETGYNLFTLRQAARRAWRISQKRDCMIHYLFYRGTMQERAMALMGKKLEAAESIDGKFSTEGLIAMAGEENAQLALVRSLSEKIGDQKRAWNRFGDETKRAVVKAFHVMRNVIASHEDVEFILGDHVVPESFTESVRDILTMPGVTPSSTIIEEEWDLDAAAAMIEESQSILDSMNPDDFDDMFEQFANANIDLASLQF